MLAVFLLVIHIVSLGGSFQHLGDWSREWMPSEQLAFFATLWTVQTTLVALVYPIVLAFVTIFLQRRPTSDALLDLYILSSGALVAGLSSLLLVVVMTAEYLTVVYGGLGSLPRFAVADGAWFLLNGGLTALFLFRTVEFLRPDVQDRALRRYVANVALPNEFARLGPFQVMAQSQQQGWLPAFRIDDDEAPAGPRVIFSPIVFREGLAGLSINLARRSRLENVRLWPLRIAVQGWIKAASKQALPEERGQFARYPLLTFPLLPGSDYKGKTALVRIDSGPGLSRYQQFALRLAFSFRSVESEKYGVRVAHILDELVEGTRVAAERSDVAAFERAYTTLIEIHELLLGASLVMERPGEIGSLALLPDVLKFDRALHWSWADSYRSIFLAAINSMDRDARPIARLCHLIQHIHGKAVDDSPLPIREHLMNLPQLMMFQLSNWWLNNIERDRPTEQDRGGPGYLRGARFRVYEEVISEFVSGWEASRSSLARVPPTLEIDAWPHAATLGELNAAYFFRTCRMLLAAVYRGDRTASEWLADSLNKSGDYGLENQPYELYGKVDFVTVDDLGRNWGDLQAMLELTTGINGPPAEHLARIRRGSAVAAIENLHEDVRLIVVELLLGWEIAQSPDGLASSLALEIAVGIMKSRHWRSGGSTAGPLVALSAPAYLTAKVRQIASSGHYRKGYVARLDQFVESVRDMQRPDMISGRVYSRVGADDVASLQIPQLLLMSALSTGEWRFDESLRAQVQRWIGARYECIDRLRYQVNRWEECLRMPDPLNASVMQQISNGLGIPHDAVRGQARTSSGIAALREFIEDRRNELLEVEAIDPDRLLDIAAYASKRAFSQSQGEFPLSIFHSFTATEQQLTDYALIRRGVPKGELTRVEIEQRVSNEADWWEDTIAQWVGAQVFFRFLQKLNIRDLQAAEATSYWSVLRKQADRIEERGARAILVLENPTRPPWVWEWQHNDYGSHEYPLPPELTVHRLVGKGQGYVCSFNEIDVYTGTLPLGQSILFAGEDARGITFKQFENGVFVNLEAEESISSKVLLDLKVTFSYEIVVGEGEAYRLIYETAPADES